jgi:hypothetical protein
MDRFCNGGPVDRPGSSVGGAILDRLIVADINLFGGGRRAATDASSIKSRL